MMMALMALSFYECEAKIAKQFRQFKGRFYIVSELSLHEKGVQVFLLGGYQMMLMALNDLGR